ncbi:MAG: hypothetical protein JSS22_04985 [Proteobacteria bacterium]|nr:hypothetical protein [Pseudomonadota bacterium]
MLEAFRPGIDAAMLKNGKYSSWFKTPLGEGTGVVTLCNGKMSGGDIALSYEGSYADDGEHLTASFRAWRHTEGVPSVFGVDNFDVSLSGKSPSGKVVSCTGFARQAPDLRFDVTLVRMDD